MIQARYAPFTRGVVELDPALSPALDGLDGFDWAWLVTFLDRAVDPRDAATMPPTRCVPSPSSSPNATNGSGSSPAVTRPVTNRLGLSLVRIERVGAAELEFSGVDVFDGTPVLDIKPWVSDFDLPVRSHARRRARAAAGSTRSTSNRPMTLDDPGGARARGARARRSRGDGGALGHARRIRRGGTRRARDLRSQRLSRWSPPPGRGSTPTSCGSCNVCSTIRPRARRAHLLELDVGDDGRQPRRAHLQWTRRESSCNRSTTFPPRGGTRSRRVVRSRCSTDLDAVGRGAIVDLAHSSLDAGRSGGVVETTATGRMLVEVTIPVTRLVVVGAAALADDLVALAAWLGWEGVRRDPEDARAELSSLGPRDALVVLDHGLAATGPLLADALGAPVGYVGALGSRRTQERRVDAPAHAGRRRRRARRASEARPVSTWAPRRRERSPSRSPPRSPRCAAGARAGR